MNTPPTRNPNNLAWDDGRLWTDEDAAAFLAVGVDTIPAVVAAGAPALDVPGVGRRWHPERLRAWVQGSGAVVGDQLAQRPRRSPHHTRPLGSGFTRLVGNVMGVGRAGPREQP